MTRDKISGSYRYRSFYIWPGAEALRQEGKNWCVPDMRYPLEFGTCFFRTLATAQAGIDRAIDHMGKGDPNA